MNALHVKTELGKRAEKKERGWETDIENKRKRERERERETVCAHVGTNVRAFNK